MIRLVFFSLIGVILFFLYMRVETTLLEVVRMKLTKKATGIKIVQISDVHIGRMFVSKKKIAWIIKNEKPDAIVLTGDYVENRKDIGEFLQFIKDIGMSKLVYLVYGNHEMNLLKRDKRSFDFLDKKLREMGVNVIENKAFEIKKAEKLYLLTGFSDIKKGNPNFDVLNNVHEKTYEKVIAISHNPDILFTIPRNCVDYILCGHFHGGQIWMPFHLEFKILRREVAAKLGMYRGLHEIDNMKVYINRGIGNVLFPWRLFSRPEITIFEL